MPRALWGGTLSFGLVSVPVQVVSATRDMDVRFHQVRRPSDGAPAERIVMKRVADDGEEVAWSDLGKGWELDDGRMLVLSHDDLDAAAPEKTKTIDVEQFGDNQLALMRAARDAVIEQHLAIGGLGGDKEDVAAARGFEGISKPAELD